MKLIKPNEISGKILTLIEECDEYMIIVSPYIKISKWYKFVNKLSDLKRKNIPLEFIVRDDDTNYTTFEELNKLDIKYKSIKNLHCKLYLNEKNAIVTSMNLLLSSEINAIEIAYITENKEELNELLDFCTRYLKVDLPKKGKKINNSNKKSYDLLDLINQRLGNSSKAWIEGNSLKIKTKKNNYNVFIWNKRENFLRISGILSGKEYDFLNEDIDNLPKIEDTKIEIYNGGKKHYDTIWGTLKTPLKSMSLEKVFEEDILLISNRIIDFIFEIDNFKKYFNS